MCPFYVDAAAQVHYPAVMTRKPRIQQRGVICPALCRTPSCKSTFDRIRFIVLVSAEGVTCLTQEEQSL